VNQRFRPIVRWLAAAAALLAASAVIAPAPTAQAIPPVESSKLMLVLDSSGSMKERLPGGDRRIDAAKRALNTVIDKLPDQQAVGLRVFGAKVFDRNDKGACTDSQQVVGLGIDNRAQLKAAIARYKPYGETPIGYALQQAGKDVGAGGQRTIVLVSDGEPTCQPDPCKVAAQLAEQGIKLKIEVVGFDVSGKAESALQCIADKGNGSYYDADDATDLVQALDTISTRAMKPYETIGRPITGTETAEGAPALSAGDWIDELGGVGKERNELFYTLNRTTPGSTLRVSASILTDADQDGVSIKIIGDSEQCGAASDIHDANYGALVSASISAPGYRDWDESCTDNDQFTVVINRGGLNGTSAGADNTTPLEIRVSEERPVESVDALPNALPDPEYTEIGISKALAIAGGSSFTEATAVEPGAYKANIVPGEVQVFTVPAGWGQHVAARLRTPPLPSRLAEQANGTFLTVRVFSPSRANVTSALLSNGQIIVTADGSDGHAMSYPIAYRNRSSYGDQLNAASEAGDYYVVVSASPKPGASYQVPYELGIAVDGKIQGEPTYQTQATASASASASASPSASTSPTATTSPTTASTATSPAPQAPPTGNTNTDDGGRNPILAAIGWTLGGVGAMAVIGGIVTAVILLRRRG
jgi:Ca-activated chloride channel family protein